MWSLSFYISRNLQADMEQMLGEQQLSVVTVVAKEVNDNLTDRLKALETVAQEMDADLLGNPVALQTRLEQRPLLQLLFNGGVFVTGPDGVAIADVPLSTGRIGTNYMDRESVSVPLKEGKSLIGRPAMGKKLGAPIFSMVAPIRDARGKVIGALVATVNLGQPSFLDQIAQNSYGKSGGYLLIAPQHNLFVTASDKSRIMQPLPAPGINTMHDRYMQGYEGYGVAVSSRGIEELSAVKTIPIAGWYLGVVMPTAEAFAPIYAMQQRLLWATLLLTLLTGVLTWLVLRRELAPVVDAAAAMSTLADSVHIPQALALEHKGEIGQLVTDFNRILQTWRQREEALQKSEQHLAITLNSIGDAVLVTNVAGLITHMNPTAERLTGWPLADALGQPVTDVFRIISAETRLPALNPVHTVMERGEVVGLANHTALLARDDREYQIADSAAPIRNAADQIVGVVLVFSDVTEKYRAEKAVHQLQAMLERTESMARLASFEWDVDTNAVTWSPEMFYLFGRDPTLGAPDLQGQAGLYTPESSQILFDAVGKAVADGTPYTLELMTVQPDGELRPCIAKGFPERNASGRVVRIAGLVQDITESKQAADRLRASETRSQTIIQTALDGFWITDLQGHLLQVNAAYCRMSGYSEQELLGTHISKLEAKESSAEIGEHIQTLIAQGWGRFETRHRHKDGSVFDVKISIQYQAVEGGRMVCFLSDITERKRLELQEHEVVLQLERAVLGTVDAISKMVDLRDPYTSGHERRVGEIAAAIAAEMGLDADTQRGLRVAGAVHDIGKIAVPTEILAKPGRISAIELAIVKTHAQEGYEVLNGIDFPWPVAEVARQHHERIDGSGYPQGLKGEEIVLEARILAVADVVEAMASDRPYRPGAGIDKALAEIERGRGTAYDANAGDACLRLFRDKGYSIPA